jgi:GAF domain-containing protein
MREGVAIGVIALRRAEARLFTERQVALLQTFADQAVIAIENARLLNELRQSLQQQTATADVLKVISRSTFDLQGVLDTLVESAARLCEASIANIWRPHGAIYKLAATYQATPENKEYLQNLSIEPGRGSCVARTLLEGKIVHIHDIQEDPDYSLSHLPGYRTMLGVPLLRQGIPIGVIALARSIVRPFTDKQIELVTTFADQAVIAIENVRLFEAEQQRTRELTESLERQTATTEVLRVISNSPGDVQSVFHAMLENVVRACGAKFGVLFRYESGMFQPTAMLDVPPAFAEVLVRQGAFPPQPGQLFGRLCESKKVIQVEDRATEAHDSPSARYGGARSAIAVPMLKADELVGAFFIYRTEVQPFTDKQIELVQNFAAQAVIAIENARLLNELRQRTNDLTETLEQQTATSDVLKVISSSPGELEPVFQAMLENATRICEAKFGTLFRFDGNMFHVAAQVGTPL